MPTITSLEPGKGKRLQVFLDGLPAFSLATEVASEAGLAPGKELSPTQAAALEEQDQRYQCYAAALRLLRYRPRSGAELRTRLSRRFPPETVAAALDKLSSQGLVDDAAFARFWREARERSNPRSARLIALELGHKGVPQEIAREALAGLDEAEAAYRAARRKVRRWSSLDYPQFHRKVASFLRQRGFGWEITRRTVDRLWRESHASDSP